MSVTREEVVAKLSKLSNRRARKKLAEADDSTLLFSGGIKLDSMAVIDLVNWLGKQLGKKFHADDVSLEDFDTIGQIMTFAAKHSS